MNKNILWLRNDLRFEDNTALIKAVEESYNQKTNLTIVFHINTDQIKTGTYSNDYFFSALNVFYQKLKTIGGDILFLYSSPKNAFEEFLKQNDNIKGVYFNTSERGYGLKRDQNIIKLFEQKNIKVRSFFDRHLEDVNSVLNGEGNNYKVFTSYYNKWSKMPKSKILKFDQDKFKEVIDNNFDNPYKAEFNKILEKRKTNFDSACGTELAFDNLHKFIECNLENYHKTRNDIFADSNSDLSQFLSTGQISIRQIYYNVLDYPTGEGSDCYMKQLAWRDFYNMVYHHNPEQENQEIIEKYRSISWNYDQNAFNIWKYGLTGFPIVDAAMRNLLKTGKMHNRLRMIVASFLVKDLLVDWRLGEKYFKEMLIDYDSASNIGSWQWVASTGMDASPYFRVFNPTTQSKRFDKNGDFIRIILPELSQVENKYIHEPHKSKINNLNYPKPIVDHKEQRLKILDMYKSNEFCDYSTNMKNQFDQRCQKFMSDIE